MIYDFSIALSSLLFLHSAAAVPVAGNGGLISTTQLSKRSIWYPTGNRYHIWRAWPATIECYDPKTSEASQTKLVRDKWVDDTKNGADHIGNGVFQREWHYDTSAPNDKLLYTFRVKDKGNDNDFHGNIQVMTINTIYQISGEHQRFCIATSDDTSDVWTTRHGHKWTPGDPYNSD